MINYELSSREKLGYFMSGTSSIVFTILLLVGLSVTYLFTDLSIIEYSTSEKAKTEGIITKVFEYYDSDEIEYLFTFEVNGETYLSSSYSAYNEGNQGDKVIVEYLLSAPYLARISGADHDSDTLTFMAIGCLMVLSAIIGFSYSYNKLLKLCNILKEGDIVKSFEAESEETQIHVNEEPLYRTTYGYKVDDVRYTVSLLSRYANTLEQHVNILYAINAPAKSVLMSKLPSAIERNVKAIYRKNKS